MKAGVIKEINFEKPDKNLIPRFLTKPIIVKNAVCNIFEKPLLTIITSISLEHTEILGDTVAKIAEEKAGIVKEGVPVVFDANEKTAAEVIRRRAKERMAPDYEVTVKNLKILEITGKNIDFCF